MPSGEDLFRKVLAPIIFRRAVPKARIEEWTFRLHFKVTAIILLLFSGLLFIKEYVGDHIKCQPNHDDDSNDPIIPRKVIESYCFIQTTFTIPYNTKTTSVQKIKQDMNLGGGPYRPGKSERLHHAYYQWVPYYLFFLAMVFSLTRYIWKAVDDGKVGHLVHELDFGSLEQRYGEGQDRQMQIRTVARYIIRLRGNQGAWCLAYVFCEFMNLLVVLGTMYVTDCFLGHEFSNYGPRVVQFLEQDPENRLDPMATVFPRITKCLFRTFGGSGTIQRFDALCVLPLNIVNEKIFTFLWFWFVLLAVLTAGSLIYRLATLCSRQIRIYSLVGSSSITTRTQTMKVLKKFGLSDWFLLRFLKLNLDEETFKALIKHIYDSPEL